MSSVVLPTPAGRASAIDFTWLGARRHRRAAVEDVDVALEGEALVLEHLHRRPPGRVRQADDLLRLFVEHGDIDRVLGHQVGDELVALDGVEIVGFLKGHAEESAGDPVPERRAAAFVDDAAQLGQDALGEAQPVHGDEQVAAARQKHALAARALCGMEEQPADFARPFEIGDEAEQFGADRAAKLLANAGSAW